MGGRAGCPAACLASCPEGAYVRCTAVFRGRRAPMAFAPRAWKSPQRDEQDHADRGAGRRGRSAAHMLGAGLLAVGLFAFAVPVLPAGAATCVSSCTIWDPATQPAAPALFNDYKGVELAVKFTAEVSGFITGVRFYKDVGMTGATRTAPLWSADGTLLAP